MVILEEWTLAILWKGQSRPETWQTIPKGGYDLSIMGWSNPGATLFSWKKYYGYSIL